MRKAETILAIIRERGRKGLPLERVYRLLYNPDLYLRAYARLYSNQGAMTAGVTDETVDGMSLDKINQIIDDLRHERYQWTPVRRVYIPKANGSKRALGIPTWSDKLLQEVLRSILEAYYEPQFSKHSHGFRPKRGCHTALREIQKTWKGTKWFIEGDISKCFDSIDHNKLIEILEKRIHDGRLIELIRRLLKAGYMENWKYRQTHSGTPQGGIISPLLANIYLNEFDQWVTSTLIPAYTKGKVRKRNPESRRIEHKLRRLRQKGQGGKEAKELLKARRQIPAKDPQDQGYRRLKYVRYADDTLFGFAGPYYEAKEIKRQIAEWVGKELKLTFSDEKTLITHATTQKARFLGYDIYVQKADHKLDRLGRRATNGVIGLGVPRSVIESKSREYMRNGKSHHRYEYINNSDYDIVVAYQLKYRGLVQYYKLASNLWRLGKVHWIMRESLLKTLANKHKTTVNAMAKKLSDTHQLPDGKTLKCLTVRVEREGKKPLIARFGGISLTRQKDAVIQDRKPPSWISGRSELIQRLLAEKCELCGATENIEVHHIRALKDLNKPGRKKKPAWAEIMAARKRKTMIVCRECHVKITYGKPLENRKSSE